MRIRPSAPFRHDVLAALERLYGTNSLDELCECVEDVQYEYGSWFTRWILNSAWYRTPRFWVKRALDELVQSGQVIIEPIDSNVFDFTTGRRCGGGVHYRSVRTLRYESNGRPPEPPHAA